MKRRSEEQQFAVKQKEWRKLAGPDRFVQESPELWPVYETSDQFTAQVMQRIQLQEQYSFAPLQETASQQVIQFFSRRRQFAHFAVAGTATYLFVSVGLLQSLMSLNILQYELMMKVRVNDMLTSGVQWLTQIIQS